MSYVTSNHPLIKELIDKGVISPRCKSFQLTCEAGEVARLHQEIFITEDEFRQLAQLMIDAEPETTVVNEDQQDMTLDVTSLGADWREKIKP